MDKELLGILVSYKVRVNLMVSCGGDVGVELPLILMHPKPSNGSAAAMECSWPGDLLQPNSSNIHDSTIAVVVYDITSRSYAMFYLKRGLREAIERQVSTEEAEEKSRDLNVMFIETSAKFTTAYSFG
ncbi:hypothetical protein J1605_003697 [Eschrichtius robustus]|uniref:Arrestin-C n=1 Tax=Eschrichtius robustus TaxID=9764 RepID=A0AB34HMJ0_ESCRO|nr:hypothetical protein J1605_003697 [Eschrichtius robustus]